MYKRQLYFGGANGLSWFREADLATNTRLPPVLFTGIALYNKPLPCLLYTSDAADERSSVDLGGRRIIKKNNDHTHRGVHTVI